LARLIPDLPQEGFSAAAHSQSAQLHSTLARTPHH
jgi:hypothetical protein